MNTLYILTSKTYEDWRNFLLVNSFFYQVVLLYLRNKLHLPKNGLNSTEKIIDWEQEKVKNIKYNKSGLKGGNKSGIRKIKELIELKEVIKDELYKPIWEIIEIFHVFNLDFQLLRLYTLGEKRLSSTGSSMVHIVTSYNDPIRESGIYIKYTPGLTDKELILLKKQAKDGYITLSKIKGFKMSKVEKKISEPNDDQLKVFMAVETFLIKNYLDQPHAFKIELIFEKVATNLNSKTGTIRRKYYSVINNFNLPSTPELNKIPRN